MVLSHRFCLGLSTPLIYTSGNLYWGIAPFARYYLSPKESKSLFISGSIGLTAIFELSDHNSVNPFTLGIGHVWLLNKNVGFEVQALGYGYYNMSIGFELVYGFHIYLNKSKD